jgi:exodeoxyribonuclease-5
LGALLRGPLVGLTEEELLDIVWALPRSEEAPERVPRLDTGVDVALVQHPLVADLLGKLQALSKRGNSTTPHELLSQAVDVFRVRPILLERHRGQAERALANVDLYLSFATGYAVRGLQAFAEAMTVAWTDKERTVEGRPDAQEESVALFTMHTAKGLEWPIVIPINTMTGVKGPDSAVVDRRSDTFYCPILGVAPEGHEAVLDAETAELNRERIRLWYVAATRARELLVLPRSDVPSSKSAWNALMELNLPGLPTIDLGQLPLAQVGAAVAAVNEQTRASFAAQASAIVDRQQHLTWCAPSRHEGQSGQRLAVEVADSRASGPDELKPEIKAPAAIQGGMQRGLILHKLMEEILTGETNDAPAAVMARAGELIRSLEATPVADSARGLSAEELAGCVARTLALPRIAALLPSLLAEFPIYGLQAEAAGEIAMAGIADALTLSATGAVDVVVDWKSDVNPSATALDHYRDQVATYLGITGARQGLIVLMTSGTVLEVVPSSRGRRISDNSGSETLVAVCPD